MITNLPPLVVMGVSGCGKSTIGALLGERLGVPFFDGDDFHPPANKAKMASGTPLNDEDRAPWLAEIGTALATPGDGAGTRIIACSALKRSYRDLLRSHAPELVFIHLSGAEATIAGLIIGRAQEYKPSTLPASQLQLLDPLGQDEAHISVDILGDPASLVDGIVRQLELAEQDVLATTAGC